MNKLNFSKRYLIVTLVIVFSIVIISTIVIITLNRNTIKENPPVSFPINNSSTMIKNSEFNYSYELPKGYIQSKVKFEDRRGILLYSEVVYPDIPGKINYEIPGINIDVFSTKALSNGSLKDWIDSQTETTFTGSKAYVSTYIKVLRPNEVYILANSNPILNVDNSPVLFVMNGDFIYEISDGLPGKDFSFFKLIISTFKVRKDALLNNSELNEINSYFK